MADQEHGKTQHSGEPKPNQGQKPGNEPNNQGKQNQSGQPSDSDPTKKTEKDTGKSEQGPKKTA